MIRKFNVKGLKFKVEDCGKAGVSGCAMREAGYGKGDAGNDLQVGTERFPPNRSLGTRPLDGIIVSMGTLWQKGKSFL